MSKPLVHVYEVYIRTTPEKLWDAITCSEFTRQYYFGCTVESSWRPGAAVVYTLADGRVPFDATIESIEPGRRLVHSFKPRADSMIGSGDPASRVTYEIERLGPTCLLRLTHEHFVEAETAISTGTHSGWQKIFSGLKTLLETGEPLDVAIPERANA